MKRKKKLFRRIYPSLLALMAISVGAVSWYASQSLERFHMDQAMRNLETRSRILRISILPLLHPLSTMELDRFCKDAGADGATRITVVLPDGRVAGDSLEDPRVMDNHLDRSEIRSAILQKTGTSIRYSRTMGQRMVYAAIRLDRENTPVGVLRVSVPLTAMDEALRSVRMGMVAVGVFVALLASAICLLLAKWIAGPIEDLRAGAERLAGGELEHRFAPRNIWELDRLVESMNHMAVELQKKVETVNRQRNEYEAVLSSMVEGVIALDNQERILSANQAAMTILGNPAAGIKARNIHEVVRNSELQAFIAKAGVVESMIYGDIKLLRNGEQILNVTASPLKDADTARIGTLLVMQDATRLRRLESMRRDFVANVSHEIKTPLTAIKGFVETLRSGAMRNEEESDRFLEIIERHVNRLTDIVEDLLQLSRIEREDEVPGLNIDDCRTADIIQSATSLCRSKAEQKNIRIEHQGDEDLNLRADPRLIEQALTNLLDNAIKYSPDNSVVRITTKQEGADAVLRVTDQGAGIASKHLPRLFERFYRVDLARSRSLGGTGLGLAIVKHIARAHGGDVSVDSTPGKGSAFTIRLPQKKPENR